MDPWLCLGLVAAAFAAGVLAGKWWGESRAYKDALVRLAEFNIQARRRPPFQGRRRGG